MGNELPAAVRVSAKRYQGKLLLESSEIVFRGADLRLKIAFADMSDVTAAAGELRVKTISGVTVFELGAAAEKWREKILHPKTRAQKLGVKAGTTVRLAGEFEADFLKELKVSEAVVIEVGGFGPAEITFLAAVTKKNLAAIGKLAKKMKNAQALWVVYPKGKKELTEIEVINSARKTGLKDLKVVGFSATHTALKFVLPIEKR
jgi:hypothetical protein